MSAAGEPAGFTLLEMLVILAILALVSGIAFPALDKAMRRQAFQADAVRVDTVLRRARAAAIARGTSVRVRAGEGGHALAGEGAAERLAGAARVTLPAAGLAFYADGSASGGAVALRDGRLAARWRVAGATAGIARQ
jgi:general secretion pathway protein H